MIRWLKFLTIFSFAMPSLAANWFASPSAGLEGDGSAALPWNLHRALATNAIVGGDTLWLAAGTYAGPFQSYLTATASNNPIVVRGTGDSTKITDTFVMVLNTNIPAGTNGQNIDGIQLLGSEILNDGGYWLRMSNQFLFINNKSGSNIWQGHVTTNYGSTNHIVGENVYLENNYIEHVGSYVTFADFTITPTLLTNRNVNTAGGNCGRAGLNLPALGRGNKAFNLVIYNVGHPAIGLWNGGEVNGCIEWGNGIYDAAFGGDGRRGNGLYSQNPGGTNGPMYVRKFITFRNFTEGAEAYGQTGPVKDTYFEDMFAFANPGSQLAGWANEQSTSNVWFNRNVVYGGTSSFGLRYGTVSNVAQYVVNNTIMNNGLTTAEQASSVYTNNDIFLARNSAGEGTQPVQYQSSYYPSNALNISWNRNRYYIGQGTALRQWYFRAADVRTNIADQSNQYFYDGTTNGWVTSSGFDLQSVTVTNWPNDFMQVRVVTNDWNPRRLQIAVTSTANSNYVNLDLAALGYTSGQGYRLRDAQSYFTTIASGFYNGSALMLPLTNTAVSEITGVITHYTNTHTATNFNAFVLDMETLSSDMSVSGTAQLTGNASLR